MSNIHILVHLWQIIQFDYWEKHLVQSFSQMEDSLLGIPWLDLSSANLGSI